MRRRDFLSRVGQGVAAGALTTAIPGLVSRALAAAPSTHRFVFVVNQGGWDPLNALAPLFSNPNVEMPILSTATTIGGLPLVDSEQRPAVRAFFARHASRALILHGVDVKSVAHEVCQVTLMTGQATGDRADFATLLAEAASDSTLPHLVLAGPVYPGPHGALVARAGASGQLQALVDGSILSSLDAPVATLTRPGRDVVADFVGRRAAAWSAGHTSRRDLFTSHERARRLEDLRGSVSLATDGSFGSQLETALGVLRLGLARCVTVSPPINWDTHTDSDNQQSPMWDGLFASLDRFIATLAVTPAPGASGNASPGSLADDTTVVVLSEMSRTPRKNSDAGRDHWPFTSVLVVGPNVTGGRVVGAFDAGYRGVGVDPGSGELDPRRAAITPAQLGATLMALADLDPGRVAPGVEPLLGVLA
jgi:uncharacterized protein (DUF1501 family)